MKAIAYERLKETLYYERLTNGLDVYVLPKEGFQKTYATFTTKYGSIDNHFQIEGGQRMKVPDGVAHFLEHKMFEEPEGDVFAKFASQGASANAFTSFDRTAYLFSATEQIMQNLGTLIDFVQNPYFTNENVEKEKGIIGQEIKMYEDNPDWRVYFGLIEALYQSHPVHIDIAGTTESIEKITKETLYDCYQPFYHPGNMLLFVVGGVQPDEVIAYVKANQASKSFQPQREIKRFFEEEPEAVRTAQRAVRLPVAMPKCLFGIKEIQQIDGKPLLHKEISTKLALDILLSPSSSLYQSLYDKRIITDSFGHEFNCAPNYAFSVIGGDTKQPELLVETIRSEVDLVIRNGIDRDDFERNRKKKIGNFLRMLNSPEAIANEFTKYRFRNTDLFDVLPVYEAITLEEVNDRLQEHFQWDRMAVSVVRSEAE